MEDYVNFGLNLKAKFYYKVSEFLTTFESDKNKNKPFTHEEIFKGDDLRECKVEAEKYYWERLNGMNSSKFFLPFESPENFDLGKNASFSITLSLIEEYGESNYIEYPLLGEDEDEMKESREVEEAVLNREIS